MSVKYLGTITRIKRPPFYLEYFLRPNCRFLRIRRLGSEQKPLFESVQPPQKWKTDNEVEVAWGLGFAKRPPPVASAFAEDSAEKEVSSAGPRAENVVRGGGKLAQIPKQEVHKRPRIKFRSVWDKSPIRTPKGGTPLHWAVDPWKEEDARLILEKGVLDINARDEDGRTPLHLIATQNQPEAAQLLLDFGADINAVDNRGYTPLHTAAWGKVRKVLGVLLEAGANVEARDINGQTALYTATRRNCSKLAEMLLDAGAKMDPPEGRDTTLIHFAIRLKRKKILEMLLARSDTSRVNATEPDGATPLHITASQDQYLTAYILLKNKANPNAQNAEGKTPLHIAAGCGAVRTAAVLCRMGADPKIVDYNGAMPNEEFIKTSKGKTVKGLEGLVKPAEINFKKQTLKKRQIITRQEREVRSLRDKSRMGSGDDWDDNLDKLKERQRKKRRGYVLLHLHKKIMEEANKKRKYM